MSAAPRSAQSARRWAALGLAGALAVGGAVLAVPTAASAAIVTHSNTTAVAIPDAIGGNCNVNTANGVVTSTITVPDAGSIADVRVGLSISHTWQSDIVVDLASPEGTSIRLVDRVNRTENCGSSADNIVATLDDAASTSIESYGAAGGTYLPMEALSAFDDEDAAGTWTLTVTDVSNEDVGTLNSWSLEIAAAADLAVADTSASESDASAVFTVTRTGPLDGTDTVSYATADGTAVAGEHYIAASGTLTFAPGVETQTVSVGLIDDDVHGPSRTFSLDLGSPTGTPAPTLSTASATATIADDDPQPDLAIADATASEGDASVALTVTRTGALGATDTVDYATADGTAVAGADYTATSGTLTFAPGDTSAVITVPLLDDDLHEGDHAFTVVLGNPGGTPPTISAGTGTVTITDDDDLAELGFAAGSLDLVVGAGQTQAVLTVTRTGALGGTDTVEFATVDVSAAAGIDYTAMSGTLEFAPGEATAEIVVPLLASGATADREFLVVLSDPAGAIEPELGDATATVTITPTPVVPAAPLTSTGSEPHPAPIAAGILLLLAGVGLALVRRAARR